MKAYWGSGSIAPPIFSSALDGGEWSASHLGRFTPRKRDPGTHFIGGWAGPRTVLDAVAKRTIPSPLRESSPRTPIFQPVAQRYTEWAITALLPSPLRLLCIYLSHFTCIATSVHRFFAIKPNNKHNFLWSQFDVLYSLITRIYSGCRIVDGVTEKKCTIDENWSSSSFPPPPPCGHEFRPTNQLTIVSVQ
jgi:hypothetical protein